MSATRPRAKSAQSAGVLAYAESVPSSETSFSKVWATCPPLVSLLAGAPPPLTQAAAKNSLHLCGGYLEWAGGRNQCRSQVLELLRRMRRCYISSRLAVLSIEPSSSSIFLFSFVSLLPLPSTPLHPAHIAPSDCVIRLP